MSLLNVKQSSNSCSQYPRQARIISPIYTFHQWLNLLNAYSQRYYLFSVAIRLLIFSWCKWSRWDANCRGKSDGRADVYSRKKVSSSRDSRFGANFKNKTTLKSLFTSKGNLCIYLISLHRSLSQQCSKKLNLVLLQPAYLEGGMNTTNCPEKDLLCALLVTRWDGDLAT